MNFARRMERLEKLAQVAGRKGEFLSSALWREWGSWLLAALDDHRDLQAMVREEIAKLQRSGPTDFETLQDAIVEVIWSHHGRRGEMMNRLGTLGEFAKQQGYWDRPAFEWTDEDTELVVQFSLEETGRRCPTREEIEAGFRPT